MSTQVNYASSDILEYMLLSTLPDFGEHGDGIINANMLTAYLKEKNCKKVVDGGLEFWAGITKAESSNAKWQGKGDDLTLQLQDPKDRMRFEVKTFTNAMVINDVEKAQNKGRAAIRNFVLDKREQAESTIENAFNSGFWTATPGSNEPLSIPAMVSATPTSGTIGGLNRSGNAYLQNRAYTTAIADIGSEAGIGTLTQLCIEQSVGPSKPDLAVLDTIAFSNLSGYLAAQRRYAPNQKMGELGFSMIELNGMMVGYENLQVLGDNNTITSGYMYLLNTKFIKLMVLRDGNSKWGTQFERVGASLNKFVPYTWLGNLITNNPRAHVVATSVSTS